MLTDQQHPITPPPGLVAEWCGEWYRLKARINTGIPEYVATQAARWGADQELKACEEWLPSDLIINGESLRDVRRPKPPSLAEQATAKLDIAVIRGDCITTSDAIPSLRAALKRLQELEEGND